MTTITLKPNSELIHLNFDGYKLKSDPYPTVFTRQIENGIYQNDTRDSAGYLYTRMESLHNHLFSDPFDQHTVYVFNKKGHLLMYSFTEGFVPPPVVVWQENLELDRGDVGESFLQNSPSLSFPSSNFAVTSNGFSILNILQTGDRSTGTSWLNVKEMKVPPGIIVHSVLVDKLDTDKFRQEIHCLLVSVATPEMLKKDSLHQNLQNHFFSAKVSTLHVIYWLTFGFDGTTLAYVIRSVWELTRERRLVGLKSIEYASFDQNADGVVLLSHDDYCFSYDSLHPVVKTKDKYEKKRKILQKEIKLWLKVGEATPKEDLKINVRVQDIRVQHKESFILEKRFLNPVESQTTTWKLDNGKLEICFLKSTDNVRWQSLFEGGDKDGEEIINADLIQEVHDRLAHLTSEQWNPNPDPENPAFNPGQLEECDNAVEDLLLAVIDGSTHTVSHFAHLGAVQHLFNVRAHQDVMPSFCLRHDVDGLLWKLTEDRNFEHVATYDAFGYVRASKTMAKFIQGSPDNSYAAICDVNSHVYVFCQPGSFGGELRNRKSGKVTTTIAHQLVISLRNHDEVMGFYCASDCMFVLTSGDLFVYVLPTS